MFVLISSRRVKNMVYGSVLLQDLVAIAEHCPMKDLIIHVRVL